MIPTTSPAMPAFLLCLFLLCATTLAGAHGSSNAPSVQASDAGALATPRAIEAVPQGASGWPAMANLATTAGSADRALAAPATKRALQIAHALDVFDLDDREIPRSQLRDHRSTWLTIASNDDSWVDIRVHALEIATRFHTLLRSFGEEASPALWQPFLSSQDTEMRAAAITLVPDFPELRDQLKALVIGEDSEEVALSAAQRLCGPLRGDLIDVPPLSSEERARVQALATRSNMSIVARAQLAPCLIVDRSAESRRALAVLLQKSPPSLRRHLVELTRAPRVSAPE